MKHILLPILGVMALIAVVGYFVQNLDSIRQEDAKTPEVKIADSVVKVEVANTPSKRRKGLSKHKELTNEQGMLFIMDEKAVQTFWMKDMDFAIDIIWIDSGKIVGIEKSVQPEPGTPSYKLQKYSSNVLVDYVLEVNSGFADKNGIKAGDGVDLSQL